MICSICKNKNGDHYIKILNGIGVIYVNDYDIDKLEKSIKEYREIVALKCQNSK